MRVLFLARHFTYFRNFESVIRALAARGHVLHLAAERDETLGGSTLVEGVAAEYANVTFGDAPGREPGEWTTLATKLRLSLDYLRYLEPMYGGTPRLRARAAERAPYFAVRFGESVLARVPWVRRLLRATLRAAERAVPGSARLEAFIRDARPDVVLITPLLGVVGSPQPDYLRAARALRIPVGLCVWSWDHLSSKALIRDVPDRVLVWNDIQKDEAVRLHGVPADRIAVTGAQCFDQWFDRAPSRDAAVFRTEMGLPVEGPLVLYVGSALFGGSPSEAAFVLRWIAALRESGDPVLTSAAILVRPHPQRMAEWAGVSLAGLGPVAVRGGNPVTPAARNDYFDALHNSAAVVGLNTSAFIEAAIVGRPVLAILPPEYQDNQEGTLHFRYLMEAGGGLLRTSRALPEHARQLAETIAVPRPARHDAFVRAFVRPRGLDVPATAVVVSEIEALATHAAAPAAASSRIERAALGAVRRLAASPRHRAWLMDERDRRTWAWSRTKARARAGMRAEGLDAAQRDEAEKQMRERRTAS